MREDISTTVLTTTSPSSSYSSSYPSLSSLSSSSSTSSPILSTQAPAAAAATTTTRRVTTTTTTTTTTTAAAAISDATLSTDSTSTDSAATDSNIPAPRTQSRPYSTPVTPAPTKRFSKKSLLRRYYKSGSIGHLQGLNKRHDQFHPAADRLRAKLQKLALKHSTAAASRINGINKPDYANPTGSGSGDSQPKRSPYWKSLPDEVVGRSYEPITIAVSNSRNETETGTGTTVAALNNATYSETVHDEADESSASDGQESVFAVTDESIVRARWQDADPTNGTGSRNDSESTTGRSNSTEVNSTRKRRFDVASNDIPTFPRPEPPLLPTGSGFRPEAEIWDVNRLGREMAGGGGRRVSQNERYSKVGRDPPMWAPVEPLQTGGPVLREPVDKGTIYEEPYEPIPPLAKNDAGADAHRKWKSTREPEPDMTSSAGNRTSASLRRRPEAKEGGPSASLGKIASPLERKWIRKAEVASATAVVGTSPNGTESTSGVQRNESADAIRNVKSDESDASNDTKRTRHPGKSREPQSTGEDVAVNRDEKEDCTATSWKNVQLIQDALTGGYYVLQTRVRGNCSKQDAAKKKTEEKLSRDQDDEVALKSAKEDDITRKTGDQGTAQTHASIHVSTDKLGEAGWMFSGADGKPDTDGRQLSKPSGAGYDSSPAANNSKEDSEFQQTQPPEGEVSPDLAANLLRYYVIGKRPRNGLDSDGKEDARDLNSDDGDRLPDQEQVDLISIPGGEEISPDILPTGYRTPEGGLFWQPFPIPGPESPWNVANDGVKAGDFQVVERSEVELQRGTGFPNDDGKVWQSTVIPADHTTPAVERVVVPAAYHAKTGSRISSISGQSVTWGETCSCSLIPMTF